ncbi:MAG: restriction endonuclease subunit S [Bacteroidales bacterium]|nr:restriction endonuclease subunit S [Bacteroidales bacterium]
MNRIDELIQQFCPGGVEFKNLGEIIISLKTGLNPRKNFVLNSTDSLNYYVTVRELNGIGVKFYDKTDRVNNDALKLINNRSNLEMGDVLFSGTGTIGRTAIVEIEPNNWNIKEGVYAIKPNRKHIISKFLLFYLNSAQAKSQIENKIVGSPVCSIPMVELKKISIPIPPLPIQQEIVSILDKFTSLEAELEAELEARKKQYEYYRNQLLTPVMVNDKWLMNGNEVEWKTLGEIGEFVRGKRFVKDNIVSEGVPCIHYGEMYTHYHIWTRESKSFLNPELATKLRFAHPGDVIIVAAGETIEDIGLGVAWLGESNIVIHDACFAFSHNLNPKYVAHYLQTELFHSQITKHISSGKISSINASGLSKATIPIPSLSEQEQIADILDKFDILVNDISEGLPAEIEARRKQYEYYRGKLLNFNGQLTAN